MEDPGESQIFDLALYKKARPNDPETDCHEFQDSDKEPEPIEVEGQSISRIARCYPRHASVVIPFQVNMASGSDPFLSIPTKGIVAQESLAEQAGCIQRFQHRTCLFSVYIYRTTARLIRWDRAGAVITTPVDYAANPEILLSFLLRISVMTDEELGYDPTVAPADDEQISELMQHDCPKHLKGLFKEAFLDDRAFIQQVTIRDRVFLIGKLHNGTWSATGRGTKGYIAYNVAEKKLCYIKDDWRNPRGHAEHETYEILRKAQVQNVATCIVGEDVTGPGQMTTTRAHFKKEIYRNLSNRVHYRIALREIGLPLSEYKNSGQLCEVVYHAFQGEPKFIDTVNY